MAICLESRIRHIHNHIHIYQQQYWISPCICMAWVTSTFQHGHSMTVAYSHSLCLYAGITQLILSMIASFVLTYTKLKLIVTLQKVYTIIFQFAQLYTCTLIKECLLYCLGLLTGSVICMCQTQSVSVGLCGLSSSNADNYLQYL